MPLAPEAPVLTAPPCDVCGAPGPYQCWEHNLCQECNAAVWAVLPTCGEISEACAVTDAMPVAERIEKTNAEYLRRMRLWVAKRRAARVA